MENVFNRKRFFNKKLVISCLPYLFVFVVVLPKLLGYGMFVDGVLYATIARNLSEGLGQFWQPYYTKTMYPSFFEHPPLAIYIQSILFNLFGDTRWIERTYTLFTGMLQVLLISQVWKAVTNDEDLIWSAPFLFVITPIVFWTLANNELENTLVVFMLLSTIFVVHGCKSNKTLATVFCGFIAALFIFLGFLSKGVFAFYPLIFPFFCYYFLIGSFKKNSIICQVSLIISLALMLIFLFSITDARHFFGIYFMTQVFKSLSGQREIDYPHFLIFRALLEHIILPMGICFALILINRSIKFLNYNRNTLLFLLMALSATLPLAISAKNHGWYLMISMPFYALALASLCSYYILKFQEFCIYNKFGKIFLNSILFSMILLSIILCIRNFNRTVKNSQYHNDFTMQGIMPLTNITASFCPLWFRDKAETWMMIANLARDYKISLSMNVNHRYRVYLVNNENACAIPPSCKLFFPMEPKIFAMYDCIADPKTNLDPNQREALLDEEAQKSEN
ncbi:ArnT family glycosyltransferase [Fluviispira multicolorata]|uniref:Glycosyltransferase RgtA/B/C/D-like domain-containing protein n=1 Tax=Fluviispira multicolorata TaxID=2654512 RepID=A0A833N5M4_9BACT|nr:glycosyltransferase family 39 protein [Fluviispira multicolorata]KAB8033549.1 hypothetical protein GCL57_02250 [Fluviispira multicolorata]